MLKIAPLESVEQTGAEMKRLAIAYATDMAPYATLSLYELFELISAIPYSPDPDNVEFLKRPYYTLEGIGLGGDCDDKAIMVYAWAYLNGFPARFVAVSREMGMPLHHVYTEVLMRGTWFPFDATYAINTPFHDAFAFERKVIG